MKLNILTEAEILRNAAIAFHRLQRTIKSCVTPDHLFIAEDVVERFVLLYPAEEKYHDTLRKQITVKAKQISLYEPQR